MAYLTLNFRAKNITSDKESHLTMIKESICQENTTIIDIHAPISRDLKYIKQKLIEM